MIGWGGPQPPPMDLGEEVALATCVYAIAARRGDDWQAVLAAIDQCPEAKAASEAEL